MADYDKILQMTSPDDVLALLRALVRSARQRRGWTQGELSAKSGVPESTLSRLERTGLASTDTLFKVLFALDELTGVEDFLKGRQALVALPKTLRQPFPPPHEILRVRHRKEA